MAIRRHRRRCAVRAGRYVGSDGQSRSSLPSFVGSFCPERLFCLARDGGGLVAPHPACSRWPRSGRRGARQALALADNPGTFLSSVQVGITLIGILSGAFGGATLGARLGPRARSHPRRCAAWARDRGRAGGDPDHRPVGDHRRAGAQADRAGEPRGDRGPPRPAAADRGQRVPPLRLDTGADHRTCCWRCSACRSAAAAQRDRGGSAGSRSPRGPKPARSTRSSRR